MHGRTRDYAMRLVIITATWGAGAGIATYGDDPLREARTKQERLKHQPWQGLDPDRNTGVGGRPAERR